MRSFLTFRFSASQLSKYFRIADKGSVFAGNGVDFVASRYGVGDKLYASELACATDKGISLATRYNIQLTGIVRPEILHRLLDWIKRFHDRAAQVERDIDCTSKWLLTVTIGGKKRSNLIGFTALYGNILFFA
jgi:hypothetical protein